MTSLFSAPEEQPRCSAPSSPPPETDPFHAPDFEAGGSCRDQNEGEDEGEDEDAPGSAPGVRKEPGPSPALW